RRRLVLPHYFPRASRHAGVHHHQSHGLRMLTFKDEDVRWKLQKQTGTAAVSPVAFHAFSNLEENVRQQIQKVRSHPWVPKQISVRGFIYDVKTGKLKEVAEAHPTSARGA